MKKFKNRFNTFDIILSALFTALFVVGAYIRIPLSVIPVTLQTLFVMLAGQVLSPVAAAISVLIYIVLGLMGLPVFSSGGGVAYLLTPSFGYIIGFAFAAVVISILTRSKKSSFKRFLIANLLGLVIVYFFGLVYYVLLNIFYFNTYLDFGVLLLTGCVVFIPTDLVFCFVAAIISKRIRPVLASFSN